MNTIFSNSTLKLLLIESKSDFGFQRFFFVVVVSLFLWISFYVFVRVILFILSQNITTWWLSMQMVIVVMTPQSSTQHNCSCYTDTQHTCYKWCWNFRMITVHTYHFKCKMKTLNAAWLGFGMSSRNYFIISHKYMRKR